MSYMKNTRRIGEMIFLTLSNDLFEAVFLSVPHSLGKKMAFYFIFSKAPLSRTASEIMCFPLKSSPQNQNIHTLQSHPHQHPTLHVPIRMSNSKQHSQVSRRSTASFITPPTAGCFSTATTRCPSASASSTREFVSLGLLLVHYYSILQRCSFFLGGGGGECFLFCLKIDAMGIHAC
jgi:hypothetical protein